MRVRKGFLLLIFSLLVCLCPAAEAQQTDSLDSATSTNSHADQIAALELDLTNAWLKVDAIVNQPVREYVKTPGYHLGICPQGWFDDGAIKPDFNSVDVRQTQEFPYTKYEYITSDLNPGIMFLCRDLEFNSMTKYFYTNRSLPKHKLSEGEMLKINDLYRIIGHCQSELNKLQNPITPETASASDNQSDEKPTGVVGTIQSIPKQTRILYGSVGIGVLIVLVVIMRLVKKSCG
jgi:hypothetical protein